jgi:hypothetical protein
VKTSEEEDLRTIHERQGWVGLMQNNAMGIRGEERQIVMRGMMDERVKVGIRLKPRGSTDGRMVGLGSRTRA